MSKTNLNNAKAQEIADVTSTSNSVASWFFMRKIVQCFSHKQGQKVER
jgi:hypothetical protein